jgi:hypothetical protein
MHEHDPASHEQESKREDAAKLAELLYFILDREEKTRDIEVGEAAETVGHYLEFRVQQDTEMGHILVNAFESYRDPQPEMETLEALQGMQEHANRIRETLGLPGRELPIEIPPPPAEPWVAPQ